MTGSIIVGVAGGSGSGKSTWCEQLSASLGREHRILQADNYYHCHAELTLAQRAEINFDHPDALDLGLLSRQLRDLSSGQDVAVPQYDFSTHTRRAQPHVLQAADVILVEGILVLSDPQLLDRMDLAIFVDAPEDVRFQRRLDRDTQHRGRTVESVRAQWEQTVQPMYERFVAPARNAAHLVVNGQADFAPSVRLIAAGLRHWG